MAIDFLTSADYPAIRASIRADIGPNEIPDQVISYVTGPASSQVLAIDKGAPWPAGSDQAQRDHDAAVLLAAAALCATTPFMTHERFQQYDYQMAPFDAAQRAEMLRTTAFTLLAANLGESFIDLALPTMMTLAPGGRGDVSDLSDILVGLGSGKIVLLGTGNTSP